MHARQIKKAILITFLVLIAPPLIAIGVFLIANWKDEPLLPEVAKALNWQPPAHAFEDNGYLVFRGINAPAEQDPAEVGRKTAENDIKSYLTSKRSFNPSPNHGKSDNFPPADLKEALCDYTKNENCVEFYLQSNRSKLASLLSSQKLLIDRFIVIQSSKNFIEITPPSMNFEFPKYGYLVDASELRRMQAISEISEGNLKGGVALFAENARFSRRLLSNSRMLLSHMIALAMVQHDMRILSELLTKYPRVANFREELLPVLTPISGDEYSMRNALRPELDITLNYLNSMRSAIDDDRPLLPIKLNATLNLDYKIGMARVDMAGTDANRVGDALSVFEKKRKEMMGFSVFHIYFYNPSGKIILDEDASYISYVERHHDTDGYIRLVATQTKLMSENIPANKIPEMLKGLGPNFRNPYTSLPMEWDAEHRKLKFQGRQPSNHLLNKGSVYEVRLPAEA